MSGQKTVALIDYDLSVRGGVEQVTAALAAALADHYRVVVVSLTNAGPPAYELDGRVTFLPLLGPEYRLRDMRRDLKPLLRDAFRQHGVDVALLMGNYPGFLASTARRTTSARLVFCDHGALMNQWERRDIVAIRLIASRLCHVTVTLTEQSRRDYCRKFHLRDSRVRCIYNWIDLDRPRSAAYRADSTRLLSAGRFGKEKGFDKLVEAFAPVAARHPDWHLDIFGDGETRPLVEEAIARHGLDGQVHLPGMRTDLAERYGDYAFYVLPSDREGMPLVLLEAKANRLPIVSFDVLTGPREIVRDGVDGLLVPPGDLDGLGRAMERLMDDPALRRQMSDRSQENLDTFSKPAILARWRELIDAL